MSLSSESIYMKPILHIVKNRDDKQAVEIISTQARDNAYGVAVCSSRMLYPHRLLLIPEHVPLRRMPKHWIIAIRLILTLNS